MIIDKQIKNIAIATLFVIGGSIFSSCNDEDLTGSSQQGLTTDGINLTISVDDLSKKVLTKANSTRTDKSEIRDLHIVLAQDDDIIKVISIDASNATSSTPLENKSGIVSTPDFDAGKVSYHISNTDAAGADHVYVVANYENFSITESSTVTELKALKVGYSFGDLYSPMFGEIALDGSSTGNHGHTNGSTYSVELKRILAMITVGMNGENLRSGIVITPQSIALKQVPNSCTLGEGNKADESDINKEGYGYQELRWAPIANDGEHATTSPANPHSNDPDVIPLFMCENMQGADENISEQTGKVPSDSNQRPTCSYIEVTADYEYYKELDNNAPSSIPSILTGTITYRFYLGENITNDFNVERNKHYQLTLNLSGWAGLVEDGKITNGNYTPNNPEVGWRVDTDLTELNEGFVNTEMNLPIGGCRFDVIVATNNIGSLKLQYGERGIANYPDEVETGNNNRWVFVKTKDGWSSSGNALNGNFDAKNNGDGTYTLSFYAKPWTKEDIDDVVENHPDLNSIDQWIKMGYRYTTFEFSKTGGDNSTLTVRQWLPLPVMEPGLSGSTPADAELYYSRFDIAYNNLERPLLRWGPQAYDNINLTSEGDEHGQLVTTGLGITANSDVPNGEFNPEYGFHNQVAFFITDQQGQNAINFSAALNGDATPSALDYATFIAAYAENPGTGENDNGIVIENASDANGQHHYALASKEEWAKIEQYGVLQNFLPVPYWTSNMKSTQSYVYIYGSGGKTDLRNRSDLYRARMVYHKNNEAKF